MVVTKRPMFAGSYTPNFERYLEADKEQSDRDNNPQNRILPDLMFGRQFNRLDNSSRETWNGYIDKLAQANYGRGRVYAAGALVVEYVSPQSMWTLFSERDPSVFNSHDPNFDSIDEQMSLLRKNYTDQVRSYEKISKEFCQTAVTYNGDESPVQVRGYAWGAGDYSIEPNFGIRGRRAVVGFTSAARQQFEDEFNLTKKFLIGEDFPKSLVRDLGIDVIMGVYDAKHSLERVGMKMVGSLPESVSLQSPKVVINDNKPPITN